ncbi:hypothetical protein JBE04_20430 [Streptomyces sp. PRKS01-29]|nr:hypothetical protein [Streptomyces sabulosicollis]MBI0296761.1 hypothetical protein [Streptomyces sabulosicollis]
MTAIVFASAGGRKYHFDKQCKAFDNAQMLSDLDCGCDTYCTHRLPRMHGLQRMSSTKAAMDGKLPCLTCVPPHLREMPKTETFGHEPIELDGDHFCARCRNHGFDEDGDPWSYPTLWPCTSAAVLGIVERGAA